MCKECLSFSHFVMHVPHSSISFSNFMQAVKVNCEAKVVKLPVFTVLQVEVP